MEKKKQMEIALDFYTTPLSISHLAKKHKVSHRTIKRTAEKVGFHNLKKDFIVIKVERKSAAYAEEVLKRFGVKFETPENFELIEKIESKINEMKEDYE